MLGGQMAGGGVGVAPQEELILMHCTLDMAHAVPQALRAFAPLYVETVEKWRKAARDISEGREADIVSPLEQYRRMQAEGKIPPGGPGPGFQPPIPGPTGGDKGGPPDGIKA